MPAWLQPFFDSPFIELEARLLGLVLLFLIIQFVLRAISGRVARQLDRAVRDPERRARLHTLLRITRDLTILLLLLVIAATALQLFGLDLGLLLVSVGAVSVLISVSSQNIIRDILTGILILAEDQFRVGDLIEVGSKKGNVERFTLRATYLRDDEGALHIISNGEMRIVSKFKRKPPANLP